jgi:guanine deaminase
MTALRNRVLLASGFQAPVPGEIDAFRDALIAIGADGRIESVLRPNDPRYDAGLAAAGERLVRLPAGHVLLPGFVDLHVHAPQYPQLGQALDVPLEVWLQKHTFPLEARYADAAFAERAYGLLVTDLLANGTTTALYFATIHQEATRRLVEACLARGQRAVIGKVAMDDPGQCPDYYRDASPDAAIRGTADLAAYVAGHPDNRQGLVHAAVTPRFIPACTDATLDGLGRLAREGGLHVQTHCSESDWEHGFVLDRHGCTDTQSLDRFGLLGRRSVLAHAVFLTPDDVDTLCQRRASVAHCPLSNAYFAGAVFPLRAALDKGLQVGLGSDVSGGPDLSLFAAARGAILAARLLESGTDPDRPRSLRGRADGSARIDVRTAFHLATAGGGKALDLPIGQFAPGFHFDAMALDPEAANGGIRLFDPVEHDDGLLQKILYQANRANIASVWVDGNAVR